ncbi:hypothetical protein BDQ94DRAFT_166380 [Aspergillus welwitschiae]|uniref:Uncharacterized protein n=1 Tax=Aspergillus welwitschiae TaxID=1341132 RepID=A0A3F3QGD8_9EURO|nr:hypothetical protein BDQ94DRAFT_166380 [Aspergillus welwitschiae]RDH38175.1 hypothetical protein BDQ94DRAFT_166380 [Aspergillus welwitschiae]
MFAVSFSLFSAVFSDLDLSLTLHHLDALELPNHLPVNHFGRFDASNFSDQGYLGIHRTLNATVPLLQTPVDNPHATLITFFLNAVDETLTAQDKAKETFELPTKKHISGYLPSKEQSIITQCNKIGQLITVQAMIKDFSHIFERYIVKHRMREAAKSMGTVMKQSHTIVEKWPFRMKLLPGQPTYMTVRSFCGSQGHVRSLLLSPYHGDLELKDDRRGVWGNHEVIGPVEAWSVV